MDLTSRGMNIHEIKLIFNITLVVHFALLLDVLVQLIRAGVIRFGRDLFRCIVGLEHHTTQLTIGRPVEYLCPSCVAADSDPR